MKKILILFILTFALVFPLCSCKKDKGEEEVSINDLKVETYSSKNKVSNKKDPKIVESFYDNNDNWYYVIEVGSIARMPLQNMSNDGMIRWTQNSSSYKRTITSTVTNTTSMKEIVENQVTNAISSSVEEKIKSDTNLNVEFGFKPFNLGDASVKATQQLTIESLWKSNASYENKFKSSYEQVSSRTETETITETIEFDSNCPTGYYGWTLCGNVKVYAFVIYNDLSQIINISYISDIVSSTWCFDYLTDEEYDNITLEFDYNDYIDFALPELTEPETYFDVDKAAENLGKNMVNVSFDANGGYVKGNIMVAEGEPYANLPIATYNSEHYFAGWYDEFGNKIKNDTICNFAEDHKLTAKWGSAVYTTNLGNFTVEEGKFHTDKFKFNLNKQELLDSGYTKFKIKVDFNISCDSDVDKGIKLGFEQSGIELGATNMGATGNGGHKNFTFSKGNNVEFLTSNFVEGENELVIEWENENLHLFKDFDAHVKGFTLTLIFYNPDEEAK